MVLALLVFVECRFPRVRVSPIHVGYESLKQGYYRQLIGRPIDRRFVRLQGPIEVGRTHVPFNFMSLTLGYLPVRARIRQAQIERVALAFILLTEEQTTPEGSYRYGSLGCLLPCGSCHFYLPNFYQLSTKTHHFIPEYTTY
jgi:hypothetical protein